MNSILDLQRIGWLLQGVLGAAAAVATAAHGLWGTFAADSMRTRALLVGALALALIAGYYFVTRVSKLRARAQDKAVPSGRVQLGNWKLVLAVCGNRIHCQCDHVALPCDFRAVEVFGGDGYREATSSGKP